MLLKLRWPLLIAILLLAIFALAAKDFVPPRVSPAKTYPAHDAHANEGVTIAADPYDTAAKADIFTQPFLRAGFLPINVIISNDNDTPVALTDVKLELVTANRSKIPPANSGDIQRRFTRTPRGTQGPKVPLPIPRGAPKVAGKEALHEFEQARFMAKAVEPKTQQAGFFFFDISGISEPLAGAHLYVTGVSDSKGNELMFFDIPLDSYLKQSK